MQNTNPSAIRTKKAISSALLSLIAARGYRGVTVSETARRSGYSRQAFYSHYQSLDDVLRQLCRELFAGLSSQNECPGEDMLASYFIFWSANQRFVSMLLENELGHIFQEENRRYFSQIFPDTGAYGWCRAATAAGITYEFLVRLVKFGDGLSLDELKKLSSTLCTGDIITDS